MNALQVLVCVVLWLCDVGGAASTEVVVAVVKLDDSLHSATIYLAAPQTHQIMQTTTLSPQKLAHAFTFLNPSQASQPRICIQNPQHISEAWNSSCFNPIFKDNPQEAAGSIYLHRLHPFYIWLEVSNKNARTTKSDQNIVRTWVPPDSALVFLRNIDTVLPTFEAQLKIEYESSFPHPYTDIELVKQQCTFDKRNDKHLFLIPNFGKVKKLSLRLLLEGNTDIPISEHFKLKEIAGKTLCIQIFSRTKASMMLLKEDGVKVQRSKIVTVTWRMPPSTPGELAFKVVLLKAEDAIKDLKGHIKVDGVIVEICDFQPEVDDIIVPVRRFVVPITYAKVYEFFLTWKGDDGATHEMTTDAKRNEETKVAIKSRYLYRIHKGSVTVSIKRSGSYSSKHGVGNIQVYPTTT